MSDLIKELRELAATEEVADRAADELERLTKENEELREWKRCAEVIGRDYDRELAALKRENEELRKELAAQDGWPSDDFLISWRDNEIASLRQQLAEAKKDAEGKFRLRCHCSTLVTK